MYLKSGDAHAALTNANRAIQARPNWAKGYFRKAAALQGLARKEDAFLAYYHCLVLEESDGVKPVLDLINRILFEIIKEMASNKAAQEQEEEEEDNSIGR